MKKLYIFLTPVIICGILLSSSYKFCQSVTETASVVPNKFPIIIIDAGHGGFDGGATTDDGFPEKNINLSISLYLGEFLDLMGFNYILTRETDTSLEDSGLSTIRQKKSSDLHNRMKIMRETDNAIFISIHQNHYHTEKYKGIQVFYSRNYSSESSLIAQSIQENTINLLQQDNTRQIKECGTSVYLIYNAEKPACLVECGFLSNIEESNKLRTEEYQKEMAFCIALGIQQYLYNKD